jgi:hypothetical protein
MTQLCSELSFCLQQRWDWLPWQPKEAGSYLPGEDLDVEAAPGMHAVHSHSPAEVLNKQLPRVFPTHHKLGKEVVEWRESLKTDLPP